MRKYALVAAVVSIALAACTRVETGEVGLRVGFDKQIKMEELPAGSFNQDIWGDVLTFPVRDVRIDLENKNPVTSDNTPLSDFDVSMVYSINPTSVAELYTTKSRAFHRMDDKRDILLMYSYLETVLNNASYKVVRTREAQKVVDDRTAIEQDIKEQVEARLKEEKLDASIRVSQILVRSIQPNQSILNSAIAVITAKNTLKAKEVEVETAKKEAERILALSANSKAIEYMQAQALTEIADGIKNGKVNTVVVPYDFKGMVNITTR